MADHLLDTLIIGAGPAGLAVAHTLQAARLNVAVYEKGPIAEHIARYPTFMRFFSTNENLELAGFPIQNAEDKPTRQQYLDYLVQFAKFHRIPVYTYRPVTAVQRREDEVFDVTITREGRPPEVVRAATVVAAVGAWEAPRKLEVPGADLPKVCYRFTEPHDYVGRRVLVVGGRNSAVETALTLWRNGAEVTLSYRRKEFTGRGLKYWLRPDIENRIKNSEIRAFLGSHVHRIGWDTVDIETESGRIETIENDVVLPMLGYDPPVGFLRSIGIDLEEGSNRPAHDMATLESNVPGLFVCGVITFGNISGHVFIENSRHHGELILPRVQEILSRRRALAG